IPPSVDLVFSRGPTRWNEKNSPSLFSLLSPFEIDGLLNLSLLLDLERKEEKGQKEGVETPPIIRWRVNEVEVMEEENFFSKLFPPRKSVSLSPSPPFLRRSSCALWSWKDGCASERGRGKRTDEEDKGFLREDDGIDEEKMEEEEEEEKVQRDDAQGGEPELHREDLDLSSL
ncbi:hypothetical protein CSUI_008303, partial [Cystoisospora suis]